MNRMEYTRSFTKDNVPVWHCPRCKTGRLRLVNDSLAHIEGKASKDSFDHPAWGPEWIEYRFSAMFECNEANCGEAVACAGTGGVDEFSWEVENTGESGHETEEFFSPKIFIPPLVLMDIPEKCPDSVRERLKQSFALFFADSAAAMNAGRTSVEALLTEMGVPRYTTSKGRRLPLALHHRIQKLPAKYATPLEDLLIAVKWLGNAGSHDGDEPQKEHVLLMYDLLEHCLSEIYDNKLAALKAAAKKVNKKKGV